ncbi:proline--tRNA ligase [Candidatus Roizmanbacteria bacterium RIFCSPLOWO2_01_FULL_37_12]|uniref:Proline--tRNA ligase n=1 Tax=Candidatus Roizmanbacteria bacterium RIFCSPLOWO2_01_FULL_37_12 TaxID=1802056 RepID=A0A1F7IAH7_9BACT|nr:MAG: proline--tRNA ligase [Candidatus Roizmanbacteria bacterium RIFCSPHIGHO2_02_FULL_37_9b]OGK40363.1 MAG: proline--tRNA ligase [Candidatus Roizmanbacteria bacterium RIFCSPLOWO2_01_FULL_37_12]
MLYSKLFGKTVKKAPSDAVLTSHKLLYQAGFIRESTAGRYFILPLGQRVQQKIMNIIRKEMNKVGAQEMLSPVLHPLSLWEETNRTNTTGFELMKIKDRRDMWFALGGTAEEMFVDVVRKFRPSYKDLPLNIYQFSLKFRDEIRARGGLLRVREFIMKDAYSFDGDEKNFKIEYKKMWNTYGKIFEKIGLKTIVVKSDNGYIGGEYCHEFVVESNIGETTFLTDGNKYNAHLDVAEFTRENINTGEEIKPFKIIEQPEWVKTMEDNVKHYKLPKSRFLKNVVYKNRITEKIIIAVIRGDLDVNKIKLEHVLDAVGQLEDASVADLKNIGTKPGYVHSWGHKKALYIGDLSLSTVKNFIGGQKEKKSDAINVNLGRDLKFDHLFDIALAKSGSIKESGKKFIEKKGIEVGNIFQLGYHYSNKMKNAVFVDKDGKEKPFYMGCYGIGIGRTMAAVVEKYSDEKGIIWPESVAPYKYHLIGLDLKDESIKSKVHKVYKELLSRGQEVLFDDREDVTAGEKFADADLIGIPYRLVVSKRTGDKIEVKKRDENYTKLVSLDKLVSKLS